MKQTKKFTSLSLIKDKQAKHDKPFKNEQQQLQRFIWRKKSFRIKRFPVFHANFNI